MIPGITGLVAVHHNEISTTTRRAVLYDIAQEEHYKLKERRIILNMLKRTEVVVINS